MADQPLDYVVYFAGKFRHAQTKTLPVSLLVIQGHVMFLVHFKYIYTLKLSDVIYSARNLVSFVDRSEEEDIDKIGQIEATIADNVVQMEPLEMAVYEVEQQLSNVVRPAIR